MMNNIVMLYVILILMNIAVVGMVIVLLFLAIENIDFIKSIFQKIKGRFEEWKSNF